MIAMGGNFPARFWVSAYGFRRLRSVEATVIVIASLVLFVSVGAGANPTDKDRWNEKYATDCYVFGKGDSISQAICWASFER